MDIAIGIIFVCAFYLELLPECSTTFTLIGRDPTGGYSLHQWCCLTHRICLSAQLPGGHDHPRWHTQIPRGHTGAHRGRSGLDLCLPSLAVGASDGLLNWA